MSRSTIYSAYSRNSLRVGRAYPGHHSWHRNTLPAFGLPRVQTVLIHGRAARSLFAAFSRRKFQLEIDIFTTGIVQNHHSIIVSSGLFTVKPGYGNAAFFQKCSRHRFCNGLFLTGKKLVILPEHKRTIPVIAEKSLFTLIHGSSAARAGPDSLASISFRIRE